MKFDPVIIELEGCICNSSGENTLPVNSDEQYLLYETCEDWEVIYEKLILRRKIKGYGYSLFSTASNPEEYSEYAINANDKLKGVDLRK